MLALEMKKPRGRKRWIIYLLIFTGTIIPGMILSGLVSTSLSTIERKFRISSSTSGIIPGISQLGALLAVLPLSHFGGKPGARKLRYFAFGLIVTGIGSAMFILPHFLSDRVVVQDPHQDADICVSQSFFSADKRNSTLGFEGFFIFGNFLHGIGSAPFFPIGGPYLDSIFPDQPIAVAVWLSVFILGPAIGFVAGGLFLKIETDVDRSISKLDNRTEDQSWIGNWWLGFAITICLSFSMAALMLILDPFLNKEKKDVSTTQDTLAETTGDEKPAKERKKSKVELQKAAGFVMEILKDTWNLMRNPTYMMVILSLTGDNIIIASLASFLPKYVENQFAIQPSMAGILVGFLVTSGALVGSLLGAVLMSILKLGRSGYIKLYIISQVIALLLCPFLFLLYCPQSAFGGLTQDQRQTKSLYQIQDLYTDCNKECDCGVKFKPVCGDNNITYYSPCFAACQKFNITAKAYQGCSCIQGKTGQAFNASCSSDCNLHIYFSVVVFIIMVCVFVVGKPTLSLVESCVEDKKETIAMGLLQVVSKVFGSVPGPIMLGALIDSACLLTGETCQVYHKFKLAACVISFIMVSKFCAILFMVVALPLSKKITLPEDKGVAD